MMTSHYAQWKPEEDQILLDFIRANPDNLTYASSLTSKRVGRTTAACMGRWYWLKKRRPATNEQLNIFSLESRESAHIDRKNSPMKGRISPSVDVYDITSELFDTMSEQDKKRFVLNQIRQIFIA